MNRNTPSRFAIFSDIHGNLPALEALFRDIEDRNVDALLCCGDVVGYGGDPNACCAMLRERKVPTVLGNHDEAALYLSNVKFFNEAAQEAILWTHNHLSPASRDFLASLPYTHHAGPLTLVHASPREPAEWSYILSLREAQAAFAHFAGWICLIGHSHQPLIVEQTEDSFAYPAIGFLRLRRDRRYLVNVGSVGQPRDHNPLLCYVILDIEEGTLDFRRIPYPVEESRRLILDAGLPSVLADRLLLGW